MRALSAQLAGCATGEPNGFEDAMTGSMRSDDLRSRLVAARDCGVLHLEIRDRDPSLAQSDPRAVADALVAALGMAPAGRFDEDAGFFTNSEFATHLVFINQNGWQPLTEATFDSGVVAVDRRGVGILWVEDED